MGKALAIASLVVVGVVIADALTHPKGVAAFGNSTNNILKSTYSALLGKAPR